jgi:Nif-specific regulatory protein
VVERAYILSDGKIIEKQHLGEVIANSEVISNESVEEVAVDYKEMTLCELEKMHICNTLDYLAGNKTKTAKALGITVKTLYNKLHTYGMIDLKEA